MHLKTENIKNLILFTDEFPYSQGETFIENEIDYLSNAFESVLIVSKNVSSNFCRKTPDNVKIIRNSFVLSKSEKLSSITQIFSSTFRNEFKYIIKNSVLLSKINLAYLFLSLKRAKKIMHFIDHLIDTENLTGQLYLYSYWCMDESIGLSLYKQKEPKVRAFTRAHRMDLYFYANPNHYLPYKQLILNSLDSFYSISKDGINYLKNELKLTFSDQVKLSYLGTNKLIDINQVNIEQDANSIISCSNIYPNKRVHLIAQGLTEVKHKVTWDHYGAYMNFTSDNYKVNLDSLIYAARSNHICNMKGRIGNKDLMKRLSSTPYDLFLNLSESEGVPVSIMEAFSFGIPVIATDVGGVSEIVENGINGYLLPNDCSKELVTKTIEDYYNLTLVQKNTLRINAYKSWNTKFNAEKNYSSFIKDISAL